MGIENIDVKLPIDAISENIPSNENELVTGSAIKQETPESVSPQETELVESVIVHSVDEEQQGETSKSETEETVSDESLLAPHIVEVDNGTSGVVKDGEEPLEGVPVAEQVIEDEIRRNQSSQVETIMAGFTEEQLNALLQSSNKPILDKISALGAQLTDVSARVSSLRKLADMHEGIENDLNNQINSYKENFYRRIVNPILMEIFDVQEYMNSDIASATEETAKILTDYVEMLTKTLQHYGVTVEKVSVGDSYDVRIHKPTKAVPTTDASLDKTIARTRKTLIHYIDGQLVERAPVQVYQFTEAVQAKNDADQAQ